MGQLQGGGGDQPRLSPGPGAFLGRVLRKTNRENESDTSVVSESDAWAAGACAPSETESTDTGLTPDSVPEHYLLSQTENSFNEHSSHYFTWERSN